MINKRFLMGGVGALALLLSGCGTNAADPSQFMSYNSVTNTATLTMDAGLTSANNFMNFDGYAHGQMVVTVPLGAKVVVNFTNDSGIPADFGVYNLGDQLAFKGAGDSVTDIQLNAGAGVLPGGSETLKFTASRAGEYRMANLLNRFPGQDPSQKSVGMWATLKVVPGGGPGISVLN